MATYIRSGRQTEAQRDLLVVANRLPVEPIIYPDDRGGWKPSPGGLVRALEPVTRARGGEWLGWNGVAAKTTIVPTRSFNHDGLRLHEMRLTEREINHYYDGFANSIIWPAYHGLAMPGECDPRWWLAYRRVNRRFAEAAASVASDRATVWVHDYHLHLVPGLLRQMRPDLKIGFFLHIPMASADDHDCVPRLAELLGGTLAADLIGFQTAQHQASFLAATRDVSRRVGVYPISIDVAEVESLARDPATVAEAARLRAEFAPATTILLSADRLDHSKGILQRLRALRKLLSNRRITPESTLVIQVIVPSREGIGSYQALRRQISAEVADINAEFGPVIRQWDRQMPFRELIAMYLAADVMLVTPLRDGMNLVAKEFVAVRTDSTGALVLGANAGAAQELCNAYIADPSDEAALAETIAEAINASPHEKARRMGLMRAQLHDNDVHRWASRFLGDLTDA